MPRWTISQHAPKLGRVIYGKKYHCLLPSNLTTMDKRQSSWRANVILYYQMCWEDQ